MRFTVMTMAHRYEDGICAQSDRDPREWDAPGTGTTQARTMTRPARSLHAAAICGACPLIELCAEDALLDRPIGVIRAGVPVTAARPAPWQVRVWEAVAGGCDLATALAEHTPADRWNVSNAHDWYASHAGVECARGLRIEALEWLEARGLLGTLRPALEALRSHAGASRG